MVALNFAFEDEAETFLSTAISTVQSRNRRREGKMTVIPLTHKINIRSPSHVIIISMSSNLIFFKSFSSMIRFFQFFLLQMSHVLLIVFMYKSITNEEMTICLPILIFIFKKTRNSISLS